MFKLLILIIKIYHLFLKKLNNEKVIKYRVYNHLYFFQIYNEKKIDRKYLLNKKFLLNIKNWKKFFNFILAKIFSIFHLVFLHFVLLCNYWTLYYIYFFFNSIWFFFQTSIILIVHYIFNFFLFLLNFFFRLYIMLFIYILSIYLYIQLVFKFLNLHWIFYYDFYNLFSIFNTDFFFFIYLKYNYFSFMVNFIYPRFLDSFYARFKIRIANFGISDDILTYFNYISNYIERRDYTFWIDDLQNSFDLKELIKPFNPVVISEEDLLTYEFYYFDSNLKYNLIYWFWFENILINVDWLTRDSIYWYLIMHHDYKNYNNYYNFIYNNYYNYCMTFFSVDYDPYEMFFISSLPIDVFRNLCFGYIHQSFQGPIYKFLYGDEFYLNVFPLRIFKLFFLRSYHPFINLKLYLTELYFLLRLYYIFLLNVVYLVF